jgi:hypothetical protein
MPSALLAQLPPLRCAYTCAGLAARRWRLLPGTQTQAYPQGRAAASACLRQAQSWELRVAMSLARLWQQQGQRAQARELSR